MCRAWMGLQGVGQGLGQHVGQCLHKGLGRVLGLLRDDRKTIWKEDRSRILSCRAGTTGKLTERKTGAAFPRPQEN